MEILSIVTLVIVAPAYVTVNATSVITTTMEIMLTAILVIVALTLVIISVASVLTITTMVATLAETVPSLTAILAVVLMSAVKISVTSVITIMMDGELDQMGVLVPEILGDQIKATMNLEILQSILMLKKKIVLFCPKVVFK